MAKISDSLCRTKLIDIGDDQVGIIPLDTHIDDRGDLTELLHDFELQNDKFGQVYMVRNERAMTIRAFHRHKSLWDYFTIVAGKAMFWFVDSKAVGAAKVVSCSKRPQTIIVPPGVWHGWMSLEPNTILISTGSDRYIAAAPDEERVVHETFKRLRVDWNVTIK